MTSHKQNEYTPDVHSLPGATLLEILELRDLTQADLADRTGRPKKTINEIIKGKAAITPETALQLETVLGIPASFWNRLETNYRASLARQEENKRLEKYVDWPTRFPIRDMKRWNWIEDHSKKIDQVRELLSFFGVASPDQWNSVFAEPQAAFRQSTAFVIEPGAVAAWLRKGEIEAREIRTQPYNAEVFESALSRARALTTELPNRFQPELTELCAGSGVALVFVPEPGGCRASGSARWLTPVKALIQLSLRGKSDDRFWFTFFHEAAHILLHGKRSVFLDEGGGHNKTAKVRAKEEDEANRFAAEILIPNDEFISFSRIKPYSKSSINRFARGLQIAPGIVVGRLQHEGLLPFSHCNDLKRRFRFAGHA